MIWVWLWALGVIVFLVFFFRGRLRWFFLWVSGLVALMASVFLQEALMTYSGYGEFIEAASGIGWAVLIFAVSVLAADLAAMIIYTIRHGESDDQTGKVVTENRPLGSMSLGIPPLTGWSKRKILGSKSGFVAMESLVDGTAAFGERMMVLGIVTLFISFFLVWVGAGLMLMKNLVTLVLIPVLPGLFVYYNMRDAWNDYREAKRKVSSRRRGERAGALSDERREPRRETSGQNK